MEGLLAAIAEEKKAILSLSTEIIASVGRLRTFYSPPRLVGPLERSTLEDSPRPEKVPGYNFHLLLQWDDHAEWVVKYPLFARTAIGTMSRKIQSEVATTSWLTKNTGIPVPRVHNFDPDGKKTWNSTRRPCIVMDKARGKPISEKEWLLLRGEKQHKVIQQVAKIMMELASHHFQKIGCLYKSQAGPITVGPLVTESLSSYMYGYEYLDIFFAPKSPYDSVIEYFIDLANMFLVSEVSRSPKMSNYFVLMWVCRSLLPASIVDDYNRGPFILKHGRLDRSRVFFNDDLELTSVVNWEWSQTVPLQTAACVPPFMTRLPIPGKFENKVQEQWYNNTRVQYDEAIAIIEQEYQETKGTPLYITPMVKSIRRMLSMELALTCGRHGMNATFWVDIFAPIFGEIHTPPLISYYTNAPGVKEEFERVKNYVQIRYAEMYVPLFTHLMLQPSWNGIKTKIRIERG